MERLIDLILMNIKKMIVISIIIELMCFIYCFPFKINELIGYIFKTIVLSLFFLLMIHGAKLNNSTGATEMFSKIRFYKYSELSVAILIVISSFIGIIVMIQTKKIEYSCLLFPSIIGLYSSCTAVKIYDKKINDISKQ